LSKRKNHQRFLGSSRQKILTQQLLGRTQGVCISSSLPKRF
jgi:hypothetical protein